MKHTDMEIPAWFKRKGYLHFDYKIPHWSKAQAIVKKVIDPNWVSSRQFLPFIKNEVVHYRRKPDENGSQEKSRPIMYASHKDALIYGYYGSILSEGYESLIRGTVQDKSIIAYRRFEPPKSNITFAKEVFNHILGRGPCVALAFDVKGFFNTLDHQILLENWCRVLGTANGRLPTDHYKVYRSMTRYSFVERKPLVKALGVQRDDRRAIYCSIEDFRSLVKGECDLLRVNLCHFGIPQGSSMSAILSNIYMLEFDRCMAQYAESIGALYRRYCDDILFICDFAHFHEADRCIEDGLAQLKLRVNPRKKDISAFVTQENGTLYFTADTKELQYLGFLFDGRRILLRSPSLGRYYRKMKGGVKAAVQEAKRSEKTTLNKKMLYGRYTYLGKRNFISYAQRASEEMGSVDIQRQVSRHWAKLKAEVEKRTSVEIEAT